MVMYSTRNVIKAQVTYNPYSAGFTAVSSGCTWPTSNVSKVDIKLDVPMGHSGSNGNTELDVLTGHSFSTTCDAGFSASMQVAAYPQIVIQILYTQSADSKRDKAS